MVDGNRVSEDMRAVAEDGDNQAVGGSELGVECRAATPAETRSRARAEITARPRRGAMLGHQGVLVDEDCILGLDPRDAVAGPGHVDRTQARYSCACSLPSGDERLSLRRDAPSVFGNGWLGDVSIERGAELGQCGGSHAGHRDIAGKATDRVPGEQRIDADMDYLAVVPRRLEARDPRDVAFENEDHIGVV